MQLEEPAGGGGEIGGGLVESAAEKRRKKMDELMENDDYVVRFLGNIQNKTVDPDQQPKATRLGDECALGQDQMKI